MEFKKISKGEQKLSPEAFFLSRIFATLYSNNVSAPASITRSLLVFDFEDRIKVVKELENTSKDTLARVISAIVSSRNQLGEINTDTLATELNISKPDLVVLIERVSSLIAESLLKGSAVSAFVREAISDSEDVFNSLTAPTLTDIGDALSAAQRLYGKFVLSTSVEELALSYKDTIANQIAHAFTIALYKAFNAPTGASITVKQSYVVGEIFKYVTKSDLISADPVIPGIVYEVKAVSMMKDIAFDELLLAHLLCLRMVQGIGPGASSAQIDFGSVIQDLMLGSGDHLPFIPSGYINPDVKKVENLISQLWMLFVIARISTGSHSTTEGRYEMVMDARKYKRNDTYDQVITEMVKTSGIVIDAFYDVASFIKSLLHDNSMYLDGPHPIVQKKLIEFHFNWCGRYSSATVPFNSPRALYEPAYLLNHNYTTALAVTSSSLDNWITDKDISAATTYLSDPTKYEFTSVLSGTIISGNVFTLGGDDMAIVNLKRVAPEMDNYYAMSLAAPMTLTEHPAFRALYGIVEAEALNKKTKFAKKLLSMGKMLYISSVQEAINELKISMESASQLVKKKPVLLVSFTELKNVYFIWNQEVAPVYEYAGGGESVGIPPFVSTWPFLATSSMQHSQTQQFTIFDPQGKIEQIKQKMIKADELEKSMEELQLKNDALETALKEAEAKNKK